MLDQVTYRLSDSTGKCQALYGQQNSPYPEIVGFLQASELHRSLRTWSLKGLCAYFFEVLPGAVSYNLKGNIQQSTCSDLGFNLAKRQRYCSGVTPGRTLCNICILLFRRERPPITTFERLRSITFVIRRESELDECL